MKLFDLLKVNIEDCEKEGFKISILSDNIRRGKILAKAIICFDSFFAISTFTALIFKVNEIDNRFNYIYYITMYLLMVFINIIYLFCVKGLKDLKDKSLNQLRNLNICLVTYITLISAWTSIVSLMDQKLYGQLMVFMVNTIIISVIFIQDNKKILIPYTCSILIIYIGLPFFQSSKDVLFGHYVNLSVFIFTSWLASRFIFLSYCNDYKSKELLKRKNILLERKSEQNILINKQLTEANLQLKKFALIDELTGIPNRRSFRNFIDIAFENYIKENPLLSIIMIDIDNFKKLNDNYGHNEGDKMLIAVAKEIYSVVRHSMDFAVRWGGEEFIYAAFNINEEEIVKIAETIRLKVQAIENDFSKSFCSISVSLGTSSIQVRDKSDISKGIELADKALYLAKISGRNCVKSAS
jgi:diguanylate cyclase (GGDEF)-like protein